VGVQKQYYAVRIKRLSPQQYTVQIAVNRDLVVKTPCIDSEYQVLPYMENVESQAGYGLERCKMTQFHYIHTR
jgi:hypothetical protein